MESSSQETLQFQLIVWNDDFNTFEWVTSTLIEICDHEAEQAEQCTLLIHFKGRCVVKAGAYETMKNMCEGITTRGISASVEELVA